MATCLLRHARISARLVLRFVGNGEHVRAAKQVSASESEIGYRAIGDVSPQGPLVGSQHSRGFLQSEADGLFVHSCTAVSSPVLIEVGLSEFR